MNYQQGPTEKENKMTKFPLEKLIVLAKNPSTRNYFHWKAAGKKISGAVKIRDNWYVLTLKRTNTPPSYTIKLNWIQTWSREEPFKLGQLIFHEHLDPNNAAEVIWSQVNQLFYTIKEEVHTRKMREMEQRSLRVSEWVDRLYDSNIRGSRETKMSEGNDC